MPFALGGLEQIQKLLAGQRFVVDDESGKGQGSCQLSVVSSQLRGREHLATTGHGRTNN
jgi:hypothetical protein